MHEVTQSITMLGAPTKNRNQDSKTVTHHTCLKLGKLFVSVHCHDSNVVIEHNSRLATHAYQKVHLNNCNVRENYNTALIGCETTWY